MVLLAAADRVPLLALALPFENDMVMVTVAVDVDVVVVDEVVLSATTSSGMASRARNFMFAVCLCR